MKRWGICLGVLTVLLLLPSGHRTDVGKLEPAELLYIYEEDGAVMAATDTGNLGIARELSGAMRNIKESAAGVVFLDTVDYVLVTEETKELLGQLERDLRPGTKVVLTTGPLALENLGRFLHVHNPELRLCDYLAGQRNLPKLMLAGERCFLVQ